MSILSIIFPIRIACEKAALSNESADFDTLIEVLLLSLKFAQESRNASLEFESNTQTQG